MPLTRNPIVPAPAVRRVVRRSTPRTRRASGAAGAARNAPAAAKAAPKATPNTWGALDGGSSKPASRRKPGALDGVPTRRVALVILTVAAACTLYVGHVHATQDLAAELQHARRDNLRLHLKENRLRGAFDAVTGPATVVDRANALGLEEGISYGPTIHLP